jgi:hypothetical protein
MNDITSSRWGPSSRCGLTEFKQTELLNGILDDNGIGEYSSSKDTQLSQRTHKIRASEDENNGHSCAEGHIVTLGQRCPQHYYGTISEHLLVHRSFAMSVNHSLVLAVMWTLWTF